MVSLIEEDSMPEVAKSPTERFAETCDTSEIWWDSSPLVYESWSKQTIDASEDRDSYAAWHNRYYAGENPREQLFRGCTTNPPLTLAALRDRPEFWKAFVIEMRRKNPAATVSELWWKLYLELIKRGGEYYTAKFNESGFLYGYLTGQVDAREIENTELMKRQAEEIAAVSSNIMIKIPGTAQGLDVIKYLTSKGISTCATLCFTLPQFVAVAKSVKEGLELARKKGVNLSHWRSTIAYMTARYEELGDFQKEGEKTGIELSEQERRWSSIAILKKSIEYLEKGNYPSKMLVASMRKGPVIDGKTRVWHVEKLAGADIVYTCPPKFINIMDEYCLDIEFNPQAWMESPPEEVIDKLNKFEYFRAAYDPEGLEPPQFNTHPSMVATATQFGNACSDMEIFVGEALKGAEITSKLV
jgi:transaldolase